MPGLLQTPQPGPQAGPQAPAGGMIPPQVQATAPRQQPIDPMAMFAGAADSLMATDRELFDDIKMRARAVNAQFEQMGKLMQIAGAMGQDTSALMPIMDTLMKEREKMMREIIGKANVPTSASKPAKPQVQRPAMNSY